ncbi:protein Jade-3 [Galendromus occidentalis]|uniref:PHD finger protein rhinoceros n=1 Tax=Galendromus occidentalis TaxID=34638 RepID=A0AAJ7SG98_9ACAR|nr:protein Jade-3 [Galendromus occidentalis]
MRDTTSRRSSAGGFGPREGDLSSLPPLIREKIMRDKPAELFRKDLITAMKVPDTEHLDPDTFWAIVEPWRSDYDKGVQIPVNPEAAPLIMVKQRKITTAMDAILGPFTMPKKLINVTRREEMFSELTHEFCDPEGLQRKLESKPRYNIDPLDFAWLQLMNRQRAACGLKELSEEVLERVVDDLETRCHNNLQSSQFGIEYDEDTQCDVCLSPESEEGNEMVFCDQCDLCVHQACYGIVSVPAGSWLCVPCARGYNIKPECALCPTLGGALKPDADLDLWAHVACALWVPEVTIGDPELMQPLQNLHRLPAWRRKLKCTICRKDFIGVCIQCCVKGCDIAYHVTCAQKAALTMSMDLHEGSAQDALELKSYCRKHGKKTHKSPGKLDGKDLQAGSIENASQRFYDFVNPHETAAHLRSVVDPLGADQIFNYWKLKRLAANGKPLLPPKHEESLKPPVYIDDELSSRIRTLVHVRQDLERARNLSYLLQRREKTKKSWIRAREDVTMCQLRNAEEHPESLRVIRTANRLDDIYDRLHSFEKIYGYPAYSVSASLLRAVAKDDEDDRLNKTELTSPKKRTPNKQKSSPFTSDACASKEQDRHVKRRKLVFEVDENRPLGEGPLTKSRPRAAGTRRRSDSTEILTSSPPLTTLSSPLSSSSSSSHKFLRIGRRRGGPFKRSMIPALQSDFASQQSSSLKMIRKTMRTQGSRSAASPQSPQNQIVTSTDYDSDTSLEILTGEELVESMANRKRTRRSRHRRLTSATKEPPLGAGLQTARKMKISPGHTRKANLTPRVESTDQLSSISQMKQVKEESREAMRSKRVNLPSIESTRQKRPPRPTICSQPSPSETSEIRVLRHREISISPEKRSKLPSRVNPDGETRKKSLSAPRAAEQRTAQNSAQTSSPVFIECSVRLKKLSERDLEPFSKRNLRSGKANRQ